MPTDINSPTCEEDIDDGVECFECFDTGRIKAGDGFVLPCLVCPAGERYLAHDEHDPLEQDWLPGYDITDKDR